MKSHSNLIAPVVLVLISAFALSASAAPAAKGSAVKQTAPAASPQGKGYGPGDGTGPIQPGDGTGYGAKKNGYHGGGTPQEMLIPIGLLWSDLQAPEGLGELAVDLPSWWTEPTAARQVAEAALADWRKEAPAPQEVSCLQDQLAERTLADVQAIAPKAAAK